MNQLDDGAMFSFVSAWTQSAPLLAALDAIGRLGGHTLVKIDGERDGRW